MGFLSSLSSATPRYTVKAPIPFTPEEEPNQTGVGGFLHNLIKGGGEMIGGVAALATGIGSDIGQLGENALEAVGLNEVNEGDRAQSAAPTGEFVSDDLAKNITGWDILNENKPIESILMKDLKERYRGLWYNEQDELVPLGNLFGKEGVASKVFDEPASFISDALTVASAGGGAAGKVAGIAERVGTVGKIGEAGTKLGTIAQGTKLVQDAAKIASEVGDEARVAALANLERVVAESSPLVKGISKIRGYDKVDPGVWNNVAGAIETGASSVNPYQRLKSKLFLKVVSKPMASQAELEAIAAEAVKDMSKMGVGVAAVQKMQKQALAASRGVRNELRPGYANLKVKKLVDALIGTSKSSAVQQRLRNQEIIAGKKGTVTELLTKAGADTEQQAIDMLFDPSSTFEAETRLIDPSKLDLPQTPAAPVVAHTGATVQEVADRANVVIRGDLLPNKLQKIFGTSRVVARIKDAVNWERRAADKGIDPMLLQDGAGVRVIMDDAYTGGVHEVTSKLEAEGVQVLDMNSSTALDDGVITINAVYDGVPFELQVTTPTGHAMQQAMEGPHTQWLEAERIANRTAKESADVEAATDEAILRGEVTPGGTSDEAAAARAARAAEIEDHAGISGRASRQPDPRVPGVRDYDNYRRNRAAAAEGAALDESLNWMDGDAATNPLDEFIDLDNQVVDANKALEATTPEIGALDSLIEQVGTLLHKVEGRDTRFIRKEATLAVPAEKKMGVAAVRKMDKERAEIEAIVRGEGYGQDAPAIQAALDKLVAQRDALEGDRLYKAHADIAALEARKGAVEAGMLGATKIDEATAARAAELGVPIPDKVTPGFIRKMVDVNRRAKEAAEKAVRDARKPELDALDAIAKARSAAERAKNALEAGTRIKRHLKEAVQHELRDVTNPDVPKSEAMKAYYAHQLAWGKIISQQIKDGDITLSDALDELYLPQRMALGGEWDKTAINPLTGQPGDFVPRGEGPAIPTAIELDDARYLPDGSIEPAPTYFPQFDTNKIKTGDWMSTLPDRINGIIQRTRDTSLMHSEGKLVRDYLDHRNLGDVTKSKMLTDPQAAYRLRIAKIVQMKETMRFTDDIIRKLGYEVETVWDTETGQWTFDGIVPEGGVMVSPDHLRISLAAKMEFDDRVIAGIAAGEDAEAVLAKAWTDTGTDLISSMERLRSDANAKPPRVVIIPKVAANRFDEYGKSFRMPSSVRMAIDTPMNIWKQWVLTASPKWIVNNGIGNQVFMAIGGGKLLDVAHYALSKKFREAIRRMNGVDEMTDSGFFGDASSYIQHGGSAYDNRLIAKAAELNASNKVTRGFRWGSGKMHKINGAVERASREVAFVNELERAAFRANIINYSRTWVTTNRQLEQLYKVGMDEKMVTRALDGANKMMNNYNALTPAERNVAKRILPFYSFQKHAIKMAVSMPFAHPAKFRLLQEIDQMVTEDEGGEGARPDWLHGAVRQSDGSYLSIGSGNPFQGLSEGLPGLGQNLRPEFKVAFERATGRDSFTGDLFTEPGTYDMYGTDQQVRTWTDENGVAHAANLPQTQKVTPPLGEHLLSQIPLYQNLEKQIAGGTPYDSTYLWNAQRPPSDEPSTYNEGQALAKFFGLTTYDHDDEMMADYQERQMENRQTALTRMMKEQASI